jgi:tRNA A-37 threonylcarbamoyl transferase component Bud32
MTLNPDDTLLNGQYRILRLLGRGGYGFVYQARDTLLHKEVAIKELIPALVGDEVTLKRFLTEARATMELTHDRIVRTHNVFQEGGNYYIVMECMAGGSLEDRLRERGSLPAGEAVRIATEVGEGLSYAHARGVVHCDLKPANILFTAGDARSRLGEVKVADFGIAHVSDQMLSRSWMTPAGFAAGTLPYMSPEQADGVREDPRVDVYALGAVLYRMLTGRTYLEFDERETPGAQADNVNRMRSMQPEPPSTHQRRVPAWLDEVVLKALSKEPEDRFASVAEMQAALAAQGAVPLTPHPAEARTGAPPHRRREGLPAWFWPLVGIAGGLLIVILVALVLLLSGGEDGAGATTLVPTQVAGVVDATVTLIPRPSSTPVQPTDTESPTRRSAPTATATTQPTDTPAPAATRTPRPADTSTSIPRATRTRTRAPTRTATPTPTATKKPKPTSTPMPELSVTWQDFHYECQGNLELKQGRPPHETVSGYRSFQALMVITNQTGDSTLEPPWLPDRWIVTDGQREWEETYAWQWGKEGGGAYEQPAIGPGATASWTWMCYPIPQGAWVQAAEFTAWGHTYRFEFPKPGAGEFNYHACP